MVGKQLFFEKRHLELILFKLFHRFYLVHFLVKSLICKVIYLTNLCSCSFLLSVIINFIGTMWPQKLWVCLRMVFFRDDMTVLCALNSIVDAQRWRNRYWVITFRSTSQVNHLMQWVWVGSRMHQRLNVVFTYVVQVKFADLIYLAGVFIQLSKVLSLGKIILFGLGLAGDHWNPVSVRWLKPAFPPLCERIFDLRPLWVIKCFCLLKALEVC